MTSRNPLANSSQYRNLLTQYSISGDDATGLSTYGDSSYIWYLYLLGYRPVGFDQDSNRRLGLFGDGIDSWWWQRYHYDARYNPWIHRAVDLKSTLVFGGDGIRLESDNPNIMDLWRHLPRLSKPSAQLSGERVRQVEGEVWLGIYPMPERDRWGIKRYARQHIQQVHTEGGVAAAYTLYDPQEHRTILVPDIDYTGTDLPERIICISDTEDASVRAEPSVGSGIELARRLYKSYLNWSHMDDELSKLGWMWKHDPQVSGVSEPEYDDDGFLAGQAIAQRTDGMPTGAEIIQTRGRRTPLSERREIVQAIATAMNLSEADFGDARSANRSNAETLEKSKRAHLRFYQNLWRDAYDRILRHILPDGADWELQIEPLEDIDTGQRYDVISKMLDDGTISRETATRLAAPLVGVDDVAAEIERLAVEDDFGDDFDDQDNMDNLPGLDDEA